MTIAPAAPPATPRSRKRRHAEVRILGSPAALLSAGPLDHGFKRHATSCGAHCYSRVLTRGYAWSAAWWPRQAYVRKLHRHWLQIDRFCTLLRCQIMPGKKLEVFLSFLKCMKILQFTNFTILTRIKHTQKHTHTQLTILTRAQHKKKKHLESRQEISLTRTLTFRSTLHIISDALSRHRALFITTRVQTITFSKMSLSPLILLWVIGTLCRQ